jgi:hypothetical protein
MYASLIVVIASLAGCMFFNGGDIARSDIPRQAQVDLGLPATTSHNKSVRAYEEWVAQVKATDSQWTKNLERSAPVAQQWNNLGEGIGTQVEGILLPWLGTAGLGGVGALIFGFLRGQKREEVAYNQGRSETLETFATAQNNTLALTSEAARTPSA